MNKQKTSNVEYLKIVEINENIFLFKSFLKEEHSEEESKTFCLDMLERCPELKQKIKLNNNDEIDLSTIKRMYALYERYVEHVYFLSGIEKNIKPKKDFIKETGSFLKRKTLELKNIFIKSIILIVSVLLFGLSFYVEDYSVNTILVAIATGLFSSLIFERLVKLQNEHKENIRRETNRIVFQCERLQENFAEIIKEYLSNDNNEMNFYDFIVSYKRLYEYIQELKSVIKLNSIDLKIDVKAFECYYQEKIEKEVKSINDNYTDLKNVYLDRKSEYKEILLKPYGLAIELLDNIIGLYVIKFGAFKR